MLLNFVSTKCKTLTDRLIGLWQVMLASPG